MRDGAVTTVAAIDCGTNSIRLLVAERGPDGLRDLHREMRIVRLGQDVDASGRLAPDAQRRTEDALADYATTIELLGVDIVRMVATSATRDASNREQFVALVHRTLGVEPEVISGLDEAALSFAGAADALAGAESLTVLDIGGGSTELVHGDRGVLRAHSMDIGAVRMTERHVSGDPLSEGAVRAIEDDARAALDGARRDVPLNAVVPLVGVAGTVTTVAALALELERYDPDVLHGAVLTRSRIDEITSLLAHSSASQRAALSVIHPGRRDVIAAGAIVLRTIVHEIGAAELVVSEHDILDGIALGLAC